MACLPRFMRSNSKRSFTPATDENTETLLTNRNSPVQIGRYISRAETPVFTPKNSNKTQTHEQLTSSTTTTTTKILTNNNAQELTKRVLTLVRQKQPQQRENVENARKKESFNNNNNNNNNNNVKKDSNNSIQEIKKKSSSKKFISNRNNNISSNTNHGIPRAQSYVCLGSALPERRPTAIPIEFPKIEDGDNDEDEIVDEVNEDNKESLRNTLTPENVKFFIRRKDDIEIDVWSDSQIKQKASTQANGSVRSIISNNKRGSYADILFEDKNRMESLTLPKPPSYSKDRSCRRYTRRSARKSPVENEKVNIPTPPPLPPHILTTAASTTSLASIRSANAKRHTNAKRSSDVSIYDFETELFSLKKSQTPSITTFRKLSIDNDPKDAINSNGNSVNGCDSGLEDADSTPKDSNVSDTSTPASHRIEGGLIFTRANVPVKKDIEIEYVRKDEPTRDLIRRAIENNDFLNNYMDKERKEMVIDAMSPTFYNQEDFIIRESDEGSEIYVSEEGYFDVIKYGNTIGSFGPGTVFGELAILYNAKRFASVRAATFARVWKIDRDTFRRIMVISGSRERQENLNFLKSAPFLKDLSEAVLDKVVDLLQRKFYETNSCIVREGEVGNEFFIIRGGTVTIKKKNSEGIERVVARRKRGEYFGEQALVNADCRQASVYADAPGTEVLKLDRQAFNSYLGTIPQLREKPYNDSSEDESDSNRKSEFDIEYAQIQLTDLKKIATLGAGAFGRVDLVSYGEKTFALKIIKKVDVVKQDQVEHVYNEKHVMMKCRKSPFIIELYKTYRNEKFVCFLMEPCMGGDVWTVMSQRRFFDEKTARFIAGCVVEAFDFLHSHNIIYRDLKPENLMLTTDGYCKLVDFGFAKYIPPNQKTNTFAGTPEYVAPEIILDRGHDRAVDYWALGILIYELLVGTTPFREQNQIKIYQKILSGIDVIQMPSKIPKSAQSLIKQLCKQLPAERLGYQRKGIHDIKKHSWFDSLDWNKLRNKNISSPIRRPISSNTDIQYFGPAGVDNDHDPPDETSGWDMDF